jgi:transcription-repair coupling factor (superfamily II helicase)
MSTIACIQASIIQNRLGPMTIANVPTGAEAMLIADLARNGTSVTHIMSDGQRMGDLAQMLSFLAPEIEVLSFPAWDCLPYDRVSPGADISARRLSVLGRLMDLKANPSPVIVLTTVNAMLQKLPPAAQLKNMAFSAKAGGHLHMDDMPKKLESLGFDRTDIVREVGEYAVRGGILDMFVPGAEHPIRLDFFGDTLESIRSFDPASQRTTKQLREFNLNAMSEVALNASNIARFRVSYLSQFGAATRDDALYQAISIGRRFAGMEHWLPLFYDELETAFDYVDGYTITSDHMILEAAKERRDQIDDHYDSRLSTLEGSRTNIGQSTPYKPIIPDDLYLQTTNFIGILERVQWVRITPFDEPETDFRQVVTAQFKQGPRWAATAQKNANEGKDSKDGTQRVNLFDKVVKHIADKRADGSKVLITGWSEGSVDRLMQVLSEHGLERVKQISTFDDVKKLKNGQAASAIFALEGGFESHDLVVIGEQDILGDRLVRRSKRKKRGANFIAEVAGLEEGSYVVHTEHGIAKFVGLQTIQAAGAPHACLELLYSGDDKLFLPVENIELLSRYGSDIATVVLDKLGGVAWQSRKAKLKKKLMDMADQLIAIAAARHTRHAPTLAAPDGLYDEFSASFPYDETEDQLSAIEAVRSDLIAGLPMDRLVCGDVGFGKTEVALRAAFIAAMNGVQVAVVVPTTLLARQHYKSFTERMRGLPLRVTHASRLVGAKQLAMTKLELESGKSDIVIGTHALLGQSIKFANLGLLVIDEEQRFGVKHKERLKEMKSDIHVLTLSATPIPRTMQLAMTGVRELSLITTPPVDRLAVRTFISPFDTMTIRETLLREHYRGGQSFYVAPRVSDLGEIHAFLQSELPELKVAVAHGQMPPGELDDIMTAFYEGQYDVLLSTTIVESGLDVPAANTLIVHRADMFGLAQLYQLRGRVGRSKVRAFALFTLPVNKTMTATAERRLKVLQSLDTLGAGFQLASHDLDIRGAGNLLGDAQSGHIKEVGFELYQHMLEEAIAELKGDELASDSGWSPQITVGAPVMIPENYVPDINLRLSLYRRLGEINDLAEIDDFGAELVDRFGKLPLEVKHLLKVVFIKMLCRNANVEKLDAGPKGIVVHFRNKEFPNPAGLVAHLSIANNQAKIRQDQSVFFARVLPNADKRLTGSAVIMTKLSDIAKAAAN